MNDKAALIRKLKQQPISVGILASDWLNFDKTLSVLTKHHLQLLHFDIADGQFSSMFTVGPMAIKQFSEPFIKDVHLMVTDQLKLTDDCINAGADIITLQVETGENLAEIYYRMQQKSPQLICGISLCPDTELSQLKPYLNQVDLIQLLTLDPRTGIKSDEKQVISRVIELSKILGDNRRNKLISVDGSMHLGLAKKLHQSDVDWIVSGSALFSQPDINSTLIQWKSQLKA